MDDLEQPQGTQESSLAESSLAPLAPVGPAPSLFAKPFLFAAALALAEVLLFTAHRALNASLLLWLAAHVLLVALVLIALWRSRAAITDTSPYALALVATLIAGPVGAVLSTAAVALMAREVPHPERLAAWYDRIALAGDVDPVTNLYNSVAMGRTVQTSITPPPVFERVMTDGTLEDRQTALGLIARRFSPNYAPALRLALVSPEPVIRVQAAAVAVKVRAELKATLATVLARARGDELGTGQAASLASELDAILRSGLLEDEDRERGQTALCSLLTSAAAGLASTPNRDSGIQALLETQLLRQGDFASFRAVRRKDALHG